MNRDPAQIREEEQQLLSFDTQLKPIIKERIQALGQALELDYFGVDACLLENGTLLIFEANAAMNMLFNQVPSPNAFEAPIEKIEKALSAMIEKRFEQQQKKVQA